MCVVTLLQARCKAVFLLLSCSVKSALVLLTNISVTDEWRWSYVNALKIKDLQCICVSVSVLTHSVGLSIESSHHQWCPVHVRVHYVGLSSLAQQQGDALDMVRKSCGVKGGPAST